MTFRSVLLMALVVATMLGGITVVALEGRDVAVLRTTARDGGERRTRVWIAAEDGVLWVEAASAGRPFYLDLLEQSLVEVERATGRARFVATPLPGPAAHDAVCHKLREKYGWADVWIGLLQDTSGSIAVRLDPAPPVDAHVRQCGANENECP